MRKLTCSFLMLLCVVSMTTLASAGDGGTLKGQFIYGGKAPATKAVTITADKAFCGKHKLVDESIVVGDKGGLANVVVFLYLSRGDTVEIHPSYNDAKGAKIKFDNTACRFEPRVAAMWTEQTLSLGNNDEVGHNTKVDAVSNTPINPLIPPAGRMEYDDHFTEAERLPVSVGCNIHPWMRGWLVVRDNPYFAVSDTDGKFEIKNIPAGEWQFQVWQETSGYVRHVDNGGGATEWSRGRVKVTIAEGGTVDLGQVKVLPENFED